MNFKKIAKEIERSGNKENCLRTARIIIEKEGVCDGIICQECPAEGAFNDDDGCDSNGWICREEEYFENVRYPNKGLLKNCKDFIVFAKEKQMEFLF